MSHQNGFFDIYLAQIRKSGQNVVGAVFLTGFAKLVGFRPELEPNSRAAPLFYLWYINGGAEIDGHENDGHENAGHVSCV